MKFCRRSQAEFDKTGDGDAWLDDVLVLAVISVFAGVLHSEAEFFSPIAGSLLASLPASRLAPLTTPPMKKTVMTKPLSKATVLPGMT